VISARRIYADEIARAINNTAVRPTNGHILDCSVPWEGTGAFILKRMSISILYSKLNPDVRDRDAPNKKVNVSVSLSSDPEEPRHRKTETRRVGTVWVFKCPKSVCREATRRTSGRS
jgi:hypothetical protein